MYIKTLYQQFLVIKSLLKVPCTLGLKTACIFRLIKHHVSHIGSSFVLKRLRLPSYLLGAAVQYNSCLLSLNEELKLLDRVCESSFHYLRKKSCCDSSEMKDKYKSSALEVLWRKLCAPIPNVILHIILCWTDIHVQS